MRGNVLISADLLIELGNIHCDCCSIISARHRRRLIRLPKHLDAPSAQRRMIAVGVEAISDALNVDALSVEELCDAIVNIEHEQSTAFSITRTTRAF